MKHCHVCSEHFEPTCFESRLDILPDNLGRRCLKEDALPSVFKHTKKLSLRPSSERQRNRALHEEVSHVFYYVTCYDLSAVVLQCYSSGKQALTKLSSALKFVFAILGPQ